MEVFIKIDTGETLTKTEDESGDIVGLRYEIITV